MARLFLEISFLFCCDVFFGPLDVLFVSLFLPRLKAAATLTDPGGGGGGTVWGIFAATQTTRKTRICQKNKKKFCPTSNINSKSCLESFQNPTSEVGDFQSFLSISRWHGRTCNHETASKGEAKFPSPPHSPPVPLRRFLFKTSAKVFIFYIPLLL